MTQILAFIASHMGFLWVKARFRITGSEATTINGGNALLFIESDILRMRFMCDRGELFLDFQPVESRETEWFSVDITQRFFRNPKDSGGLLSKDSVDFVCQNLNAIEERFSANRWPEVRVELKKLEAKRAKERFG